jgi:hypothetical protein
MRIYDWYRVINLTAFENTGLVSRNVQVILGQLGLKNILVVKGNLISILYDDILLSIDLNGKNPFEFENHAVYVDDSYQIWLGILNEN